MKTIYLLQNEKKTHFKKNNFWTFTCKNTLDHHFLLEKLTIELSKNIDYYCI